jgi:hypothetical protein
VWEKPSFSEVAMNAEIGAYQDDSDGGNVPIVENTTETASSND